jgi:hypothetical protein
MSVRTKAENEGRKGEGNHVLQSKGRTQVCKKEKGDRKKVELILVRSKERRQKEEGIHVFRKKQPTTKNQTNNKTAH